jgi:hypothetical protein
MTKNEQLADDTAAAVAARQERAAGRLLDDERLRGDLTDDEFQPLLDWALAVVDTIAVSTLSLAPNAAERRLDAGVSDVTEIIRLAGVVIVACGDTKGQRAEQALADLADRIESSSLDRAAGELARKRLSQAGRRVHVGHRTTRHNFAELIAQALSPLTGRIAHDTSESAP